MRNVSNTVSDTKTGIGYAKVLAASLREMSSYRRPLTITRPPRLIPRTY